MRRLINFLTMPGRDRSLLARTALLLWLVRIGLWVLPFEKLRRLLFRNRRAASPEWVEDISDAQIVRCVKAMSRYVPAATCLTKALVTMVLLEQVGRPASLRIGVTKSQFGSLEAHAWVESDGKVLIGGSHADISRYTVLRPV